MLLNETVPQWVIDITVDVSISADYYFFLNLLSVDLLLKCACCAFHLSCHMQCSTGG